MKTILLFLFILLCPGLNLDCFAQTHTTTWNPSALTPEQKKFIDSCDQYLYDTLGYKLTTPSAPLTYRIMKLDGNYSEYIEIDSAAHTISWKFKKASDDEKMMRKRIVLDRASIHSLIGQKFPDLEMVDLNGNHYTSEQFKNKTVYFNFWFVGCQPCELERTKLNQLYEKYKENPNIQFISLSNSNERKTREHLRRKNLRWPVVILNKSLKSNFSYIEGYPTNIILNNQHFDTALAGLSEGTFLIIDERLEALVR